VDCGSSREVERLAILDESNANLADLRCRRDVVARREIARLADQVGEALELFPGEVPHKSSAHRDDIAGARPGMYGRGVLLIQTGNVCSFAWCYSVRADATERMCALLAAAIDAVGPEEAARQ
jgi:hypothetical protein